MVEKGKMRLVEIQPGENGPICIFKTLAEASFSFAVIKLPVSKETEAATVEQLRPSRIMRKASNKYLAALNLSFTLCVLTWLFALWYTGAKVYYRNDADSGLIVLYLTPQIGVAIQWSEQGQSMWVWRGEDNWRVWPGE